MPKGKLLALLAIFAAIGVVTATGAFTTVQAERTANIDVSGDGSALLAIEGAPNGPAGDVVNEDSETGVASIDLTDSFGAGANAEGLNPNAKTGVSPLVTLTNNGAEDVTVTIDALDVNGLGDSIDRGDVTILGANGGNIDGDQFTLESGNQAQFGLEIDLTGVDQSDIGNNNFDITIDINAES